MLQYKNTTLFICEDRIQNVMTMKFILRCFKLVSGLKVNLIRVSWVHRDKKS